MGGFLFENAATRASLKSAFDHLFCKYGREFDDDDEIDLQDLSIVRVGGHVLNEKTRGFGSCYKKSSSRNVSGQASVEVPEIEQEDNYDDVFVRISGKVKAAAQMSRINEPLTFSPLPPLRPMRLPEPKKSSGFSSKLSKLVLSDEETNSDTGSEMESEVDLLVEDRKRKKSYDQRPYHTFDDHLWSIIRSSGPIADNTVLCRCGDLSMALAWALRKKAGGMAIVKPDSPATKSMQQYLDGLVAKPGSMIIQVSELDDAFVKSVLGLFPIKPTETNDLPTLASILDLLVSYTDGRSYGSQSEQSTRVLNDLLRGGLIDSLTSSLLLGTECLVSLIQFSRSSADKLDKLVDELVKLKPEVFENRSYEHLLSSLLLVLLDFKSLFTKNIATLSEKSIEKLSTYIKSISKRNCPLAHLMLSTFTGMLTGVDEKWYDKFHQFYANEAQQSIETGSFDALDVFIDPKYNPKAQSGRKENIYYLVMSFLTLFEVEKVPEFSILCHDLCGILEGNSKLCDLFWENENASKPLIDYLMSLFPSSCYDAVPLFATLCQTESSAKRVYNLLERVETLNLMMGPNPSCLSTCEDGSLIATRNFDATFERVQMIIPEEATCNVDGDLYRWNIQYSGWDFLARLLTVQEHMETIKLFTGLYSILPQAKLDSEAYFERINPLYFEPRGFSLYTRLVVPLGKKTVEPCLFETISDALVLFEKTSLDEEESRVLLLQSVQVEKFVKEKELYVHDSDLGSVGALLTLSIAWLPSCENPEPILNNILSMASRFVTKSELSIQFKSSCALKLAKLVDTIQAPDDLIVLSNKFSWNCIRIAVKEDWFDVHLLDLLALDSVWDTHQDKLYSTLTEQLDRLLMKSMSSENLFVKFLKFLSTWSQRIPESFPFSEQSLSLLCMSLDSLSNRSAVAEFILSLKPVNIKLMQNIVSIREDFISRLIRDTSKDSHCGELYVEYTWNLIRSVEFSSLAKVFPGSPKCLWDTLMAYVEEAIHTENFTVMSMSLELLANCLILTSKEYDIAYLSLITSKMLNDFCKHALGDEQLLQFFGRFVISCACSLPLRERLLYSLSAYLAKHEVSLVTLTTIAEGLSLYKDYDKYFEQLLVQIYQKFEAISADGFCLFTDESVFDTWSNLLLLSTQLEIQKDAFLGIKVLVRLICAHVAMKPSELVPKVLLLLASLFSHPELGSTVLQFCSFYHLNDHIIRCLCENTQAQSLLPAFLLNEEFAFLFVSNGSLGVILSGGSDAVWDALLVLARNPDLHPHILHHLTSSDLITHGHTGKLLDLLAVMVPSKIDLLDKPELICCGLVDISWTVLADQRINTLETEAAVKVISLVLLQLSTGPLAEDLFRCSRQNIGILDNLKVSPTGEELILALRDLLQ